MKKVEIKKGKIIETPWLRIEEAAAYVGLSRGDFDQRAKNLPHSGSERTRIYNVKTLDAWLNGLFPDIPFRRPKRPRRESSGSTVRLMIVLELYIPGRASFAQRANRGRNGALDMTIEERIARIENALIAAGLMEPIPGSTYEEAMADLHKGDNSTLIKYYIKNPPVYPLRGRARAERKSKKPLGAL